MRKLLKDMIFYTQVVDNVFMNHLGIKNIKDKESKDKKIQ